jgi:hypothetical protein
MLRVIALPRMRRKDNKQPNSQKPLNCITASFFKLFFKALFFILLLLHLPGQIVQTALKQVVDIFVHCFPAEQLWRQRSAERNDAVAMVELLDRDGPVIVEREYLIPSRE